MKRKQNKKKTEPNKKDWARRSRPSTDIFLSFIPASICAIRVHSPRTTCLTVFTVGELNGAILLFSVLLCLFIFPPPSAEVITIRINPTILLKLTCRGSQTELNVGSIEDKRLLM